MTSGARTILVLRALGLGDLCTSVPALRALRRAFPGHRLVLAAPAWQEPLARLAGVDHVVDTASLEPLEEAVHGAALAVNLHGRGPQSTSLLASTGPRRMIAFAHPDLDARAVQESVIADVTWRPHEHEVQRWCRVLEESGIAADATDLQLPASHLPGVPDGTGPEGFVVVHPGAAAPARRWPAERFGAVVAALAERGDRVVLTGSTAERALCEEVLDAAGVGAHGAARVVAGETDIVQLAATVAGASLVVANDTGVGHLATAFAVPSVVLFGPVPPAEWGPPDHGRHRALWAGRRGDPHGTDLDPGLARIDVAQVLSAVEEVSVRVPA